MTYMIKEIKNNTMSFSVIYEESADGGYVARVPVLPGCHTQGETLEEAEGNIKEAISVYLESLFFHKETVPHERRILQGKVEVRV